MTSTLFASHADERPQRAAQRLKARVASLHVAQGNDFVTAPVEHLDLTFEGIPGDVHAGHTRRSGGREPWYPRGTEMRNERQVSIVCGIELAQVARVLEIERIAPEWIGANMVLSGLTDLSQLPPRTLLFFEGGVTLKVDGDNAPCRHAGRAIAERCSGPGRDGVELGFARRAQGRRGLVAWVEKPGRIETGETVKVVVPPQRIYEG